MNRGNTVHTQKQRELLLPYQSAKSKTCQVHYDYDEKYHFNASIRRDGSSRFAKGNKWGTFGSVGAAWVLSKEAFMENLDWLKNLKLKASWGLLSNQNDKPSFTFKYKGNPNLTWEKSSTFNVGMEFDVFGILEGEVEYFHLVTVRKKCSFQSNRSSNVTSF